MSRPTGSSTPTSTVELNAVTRKVQGSEYNLFAYFVYSRCVHASLRMRVHLWLHLY